MQVIDRYGCRTGTFYIITQHGPAATLNVGGGPFVSEDAAKTQLDGLVRGGAKNLFIVEVKKHLQVATQIAEVVNG